MNKRGFTLVELMGVIVILGIISLIAVPPIINQIKGARENNDSNNKLLIYDSAELYVEENYDLDSENYGKTYYVSLQQLVDDGKLTEPVTDVETGEEYNLKRCVSVVYLSEDKRVNGNKFETNLLDSACPTKS